MGTTENNKIIVEFMGGVLKYYNVGIPDVYFEKLPPKTHHLVQIPLNKLLYDSDWNWLIEVVEKIESLDYSVQPLFNSCYIANKESYNFLIKVEYKETKIQATYNACVEFIKWYNEQK